MVCLVFLFVDFETYYLRNVVTTVLYSMRLTVTTLADEIFSFEVSDDMELDSFRALCEIETGISAREIVIFWNGRPLHDDKRIFFYFYLFFRCYSHTHTHTDTTVLRLSGFCPGQPG